ncbi:glutathione S-transferase [Sphingomonas sp. LB3N6]|uniref:glutathione S-transferase n=1 Tax=Sphingomonas fucosidasi TaxID=3096164 RepID=UPI002FCACA26
MTVPILYSFRRCPYAMRARLSLLRVDAVVELREVALRAKPAAMVDVSPKATVPVLVLSDGRVIDESLDIMRWAQSQHGHDSDWMAPDDEALVAVNDGAFKHHLDRYKYADRFPDDSIDHRAEATDFLRELDTRLAGPVALGGDRLSIADLAILPFVRQFAETDRRYFDALPLVDLQRWLADFLASALFERAMAKFAPWQPEDPPVMFPAQSSR